MKDILTITTLLLMAYLLTVYCVRALKSCSTKEAAKICHGYIGRFCTELREALFPPEPAPCYPTIVGYDGNRIILSFVDEEFKIVRQNFAACFCTNTGISRDGHLVYYFFDIHRKPGSLPDDELLPLVTKQVEEALANTMRRYGCYMPPESLTLVELVPMRLCVAFARTGQGVESLNRRKAEIQQRKSLSHREPPAGMDEDWGE